MEKVLQDNYKAWLWSKMVLVNSLLIRILVGNSILCLQDVRLHTTTFPNENPPFLGSVAFYYLGGGAMVLVNFHAGCLTSLD